MEISAGLAIIHNKKILLIHPTNAPWQYRHSIPKGHIEEGESLLECAIRETKEEIGLKFKKKDIDKTEYCVIYRDKKGKIYKRVYYFIVNVDEKPKLNKKKFSPKEVDDADFYGYTEASIRILPKQIEILEHIK